MKWVTRKQIRVNRVATAWLIRRFIDPQAEFIFVEPAEVAEVQQREDAKGFDAPGATYPHKDAKGRCSFEALVDEYCLDNSVLKHIARIVRGADFPEEIGLTAESAGIRAISHGFPLVTQNDHETVEKASFLYDALYAALQAERQRS
ncbi:MAG: chromate resistance protein ChrB domain-containing protein [Candidatus Binatia bacterium]